MGLFGKGKEETIFDLQKIFLSMQEIVIQEKKLLTQSLLLMKGILIFIINVFLN